MAEHHITPEFSGCNLWHISNLLAESFNFTASSNCFYYFFKTEVLVRISGPKFTINLGFMTEVQMMMGLKGSWVLTNFLVIKLTEFTGPPCAINMHRHGGNTKTGLVKSHCFNKVGKALVQCCITTKYHSESDFNKIQNHDVLQREISIF